MRVVKGETNESLLKVFVELRGNILFWVDDLFEMSGEQAQSQKRNVFLVFNSLLKGAIRQNNEVLMMLMQCYLRLKVEVKEWIPQIQFVENQMDRGGGG